jgi:ribokinase
MNYSSALARADLVVFGEFFLDLIFYKLPRAPKLGEEVKTQYFAEFPGGGLATTALVAAGLGTSTAVVTRIGKDAQSNQSWQKLVRRGIFVGACEFSAKFPTAMTVCAAYDGDRMMITYDTINRNLHKLLARPAVRGQLHKAKHLHLACALSPPQAWIPAIRRLRSQGLTISLDVGWNPEVLQSPRLPAFLRECDFVFPNEIEARTMTGEKSVERAAKKLAQWVRLPVVKLGRDGCIAVQEEKVLRVKSIHVHTVDATGAGDAFNGGFLNGYLSGRILEDCLRLGNICGAMATTCPGGSSTILSRGKLLELMKRI